MRNLVVSILMIAGSLISGCAGTSARVQADYQLAPGEKFKLQIASPPTATEEGMSILRERLTAQLSSHGLLATPSDASARTLEVVVTNYYMRHGATRALVGVLAGADNMQSTVKIRESQGGRVLSEFAVESTNPSAWGTSRGMIQEHADKVVETLRGAKR